MNVARVPRLAITPGEPAGIGPDITLMLAQHDMAAQLVAVADPELLRERAKRIGLNVQLREWHPREPAMPHRAGVLPVLPVPLAVPAQCGQLDVRNADYVLATLRTAVNCIQRNELDALVTGPVQKSIINDAGYAFSGHTEFLAELTNAQQPVMMLATPGLRVALVTTHVPVTDIAPLITRERLLRVLRVLHGDLVAQFGITEPHILVCGLNPHAGEGGHLGREEIEVIEPVLAQLRAEGMHLSGPLPADTLFTPKNLAQADAVLAMYHDQGLPVLKYIGFGNAINVTLGLPIIRTSVDHGTALDLAGTGRAESSSLALAASIAADIVRARHA